MSEDIKDYLQSVKSGSGDSNLNGEIQKIKEHIENMISYRRIIYISIILLIIFIGVVIVAAFYFKNKEVDYEKDRYSYQQNFNIQKSRMDSIIEHNNESVSKLEAGIKSMTTQVQILRTNTEDIKKSLKFNKINYDKNIEAIKKASVDELDSWFANYSNEN